MRCDPTPCSGQHSALSRLNWSLEKGQTWERFMRDITTHPLFHALSAVLAALMLGLVMVALAGEQSFSGLGEAEHTSIATESSTIRKKLDSIILPSATFKDTPLSVAIDFFRQKSIELDPSRTGEDKSTAGVNLVIAPLHSTSQPLAQRTVSVQLTHLSLKDALDVVALLADCKIRVDENAVVLLPLMPNEQPRITADNPELIAANRDKLKAKTIPSLEFTDTPFPIALEFLTSKGDTCPATPPDYNFVLIQGKPEPIPPAERLDAGENLNDPAPRASATLITLKLKNITLLDAVQYVAMLADYEVVIGNSVVYIRPNSDSPTPPR